MLPGAIAPGARDPAVLSPPPPQVSGPGGLPTAGQLQPETSLWRPPAEVPPEVKGGNKPYPVGQVSGLASGGDATVWVFHRGARAWNPDGTVSDLDGGGRGDVLPGPAVLQVGTVACLWLAAFWACPTEAAWHGARARQAARQGERIPALLSVPRRWGRTVAARPAQRTLVGATPPRCSCPPPPLSPQPQPQPPALQLDQDSGQVLRAWGAKQFVMPHMISLDYDGNVWVTGELPGLPPRLCVLRGKHAACARLLLPAGPPGLVATDCHPGALQRASADSLPVATQLCADVDLHQAFKFSPTGKQLLALGTRGQSGNSATAFCKPTQVRYGLRAPTAERAARHGCAGRSDSAGAGHG